MVIDFSKITIYEIFALGLSAIAILIPIVQWAWKKWMVIPELKYYPTGKAYLYCNKSGSYIQIDGVFEAFHKPVSIKNVSVKICKEKNDKRLNLQWATFHSPVNQSFNGSYSSMVETAHPIRIGADSMACAFIEFTDQHDSAGRSIGRDYQKLESKCVEIKKQNLDYEQALDTLRKTDEFISTKNAIEKELYWEIGKYTAIITAKYEDKMVGFKLEFTISESDVEKLYFNIDEVLTAKLKNLYYVSLAMQPVQIEIKEM